MVFPPTPSVNQPGATPFSFASIAALAAAAVGSGGSSGNVALTSPPTTGTVGTALSLAGTVAPSGTAVQVGLSTSATVAPTSWTNATVSGTGWTASLTPSAAGTYYIWAEQTGTPSVKAVSAAVTVSASATPSITNTYGSTYTWGINPSDAPAASYSAAEYGAGAGGTPTQTFGLQFTLSPADNTSGDTVGMYWTTTAPTSIPTSGEIGVTYGGSINAAAFTNSNQAIAAYACCPNVTGTYYLSAWIKSSSGAMQGGIVLSPITID